MMIGLIIFCENVSKLVIMILRIKGQYCDLVNIRDSLKFLTIVLNNMTLNNLLTIVSAWAVSNLADLTYR